MRLNKWLVSAGFWGLFVFSCLPYADPDDKDKVLYSCEVDEDCAPGYTCSGIISVENDRDRGCENYGGSISVIKQGDLCYYPYCRRHSKDLLNCGEGTCKADRDCVIVKEVGQEFTRAACVSEAIDSYESDSCRENDCSENKTCVFDQRGWAAGDPAYRNEDDAWRCVSDVEEVQFID